MVFSVQQIKYEFLAYIKEFGGAFENWYVGIASDPESALFRAHKVDRQEGLWIFKPALTVRAANTVQRYFSERLHTDGAGVSEDEVAMTTVYLFRKTPVTDPPN